MRVWRWVALLLIIFTLGCVEKECETGADCLSKDCQKADCVNNKCSYSAVPDCCGNEICEVGETYPECAADCPNCDDNNECTVNDYDYHDQECISEPVTPCCGNDICDKDAEDYSGCPADCPNCDDNIDCTDDSYDYHKKECVNVPIPDVVCCGNGICELEETYESCTRDCPDCDDDNECTEDTFDYHNQLCVNEVIIPCCGNDICDKDAEDYSGCPPDCPDCDDGNELTGDNFNYAIQKCEYVTYYFFEDFDEGTSWTLDPKSYDPRWSVVFPEDETNGILTNINNDSAYTGFGGSSWTDYTFKLKVKLEQGGANVYVRMGPAGAYSTSIWENQLLLWKDVEPKPIDLEVKEYPFASDQFYDVKIEAKGNDIKVYVDDNLEISYTDTDNPIPSGGVGLESLPKAYFDDIIVEAPR